MASFFLPSQYNAGSGCIYALRTRGGKGVVGRGDSDAGRQLQGKKRGGFGFAQRFVFVL